ncbi:hypothetical protein BaRGS_00020506 [Batillaria attramentaria]|uniref:Uncharacterized protein n=1 Tax=Batillaria attramentaria TaxID=370345 RepID=A0ABD0KMD4_9CAEN
MEQLLLATVELLVQLEQLQLGCGRVFRTRSRKTNQPGRNTERVMSKRSTDAQNAGDKVSNMMGAITTITGLSGGTRGTCTDTGLAGTTTWWNSYGGYHPYFSKDGGSQDRHRVLSKTQQRKPAEWTQFPE